MHEREFKTTNTQPHTCEHNHARGRQSLAHINRKKKREVPKQRGRVIG